MPPSALRVVQIAKEATWGTPVSGTVRLMNLEDTDWKIADTTISIDEKGRLNPSAFAAQVYQAGEGNVKTWASYDDITHWYDSIFGTASPSTSGGSPYTHSYSGPTTSVPTLPRIATYEFGTSGAEYRLAGGLAKTFVLDVTAMDIVKNESHIIGQKISSNQLSTGALDHSTVPITAANTGIYIDSTGTAIGTTLFGVLISAKVNIDTKRHLKPFVGNINPQSWGEAGPWAVSLDAVLEFSSTGKALVDSLLSGIVQRLIRLKSTGPSASYIHQLDMGLTLVDGVPLWADRQGNMTVAVKFMGWYSTGVGSGNFLAASVTNVSTGLL